MDWKSWIWKNLSPIRVSKSARSWIRIRNTGWECNCVCVTMEQISYSGPDSSLQTIITKTFYDRLWPISTYKGLVQRVLNDLKRARLFRGLMIWLLALPPFPLSRQKARPPTHRKTEKERQLADGRRGRRWARSRII
jgi:hypothetical protein